MVKIINIVNFICYKYLKNKSIHHIKVLNYFLLIKLYFYVYIIKIQVHIVHKLID